MGVALDTNVLVRYIMQDDKAQAKKASTVIEGLTSDSPAFISGIVLCELNWVLKSFYKMPKKDRVDTLQDILSVAVFDVEALESCIRALKCYEQGKADFSDYLIQDIGRIHGYETLVTFDKDAQKSKGFKGL
ncbi:MAG: type II toxin-antitoxin system VapC family toxin [Alphaproteobacteria bacterium]|nr:type II toxin-antitoxin system VapC family toxin [Alphaproteobacteria bacterium]